MSISADVYVAFKGPRRKLVKILADNFLVRIDPKHYRFLDFVEFTSRAMEIRTSNVRYGDPPSPWRVATPADARDVRRLGRSQA